MAKELSQCVLLYVEDSDICAYLFKKAIHEAGLTPKLFRMTDGQGAIAFVMQEGVYSKAPRPDLVLLDLNLPVKSGFDVLAAIKSNPSLHEITVVVFSASTLPSDLERSIALGADEYFQKNGMFETFVAVAQAVCEKMTAEQG